MLSNVQSGHHRRLDNRTRAMLGLQVLTGLTILMAPTAWAETVTLQSLGNGRLVAAIPGGSVFAAGTHVSALTSYDRLYLGNGYFVLQNKLTRLCLTVDRASGLLSESALRDGNVNEQFQSVDGQTGGSTALKARANNRFVVVNTMNHARLFANTDVISSDASFMITATRPAQPVTGEADAFHVRQRILGFGGALVFNEARLAANPYRSEIYHALYDPKDGLGMTFLRIGNSYGISETDAGGYADQNPDLVSGASRALGQPVTVVMSGWGPPAYLKDNGSTTAGTLRKLNGQYDYAGYAKWWADSITYWRGQKISPTYVSIQNEPEVVVSYISNHFNPQEGVPYGVVGTGTADPGYGAPEAAGYGKALHAVSEAFGSLGTAPLLIGPEVDGTAFNKVQDYLAYTNVGELYAIAHHLYDTANPDDPDSFNPSLQGVADAFPDKLKFQTEWFSNDAPIVEAKAIHDVLVTEESNAYIKWSLVNSGTVASAIYDDDATLPQSSWLYPHGWKINDNYYVMKHYSYFIRPGFRRIDGYTSDPDLRLSAYVDTASGNVLSRKATIVVVNTSATATVPVQLVSPTVFVRSSRVYRTSFSSAERWNDLGAWNRNTPIVMPPNSMVTVAFNAD